LIDFPGYAYTREPSAISGEAVTVYNVREPQIWHVPFRDRIAGALTVKAPRGGYVIPAAWAKPIGERLALHGIACEALPEARPGSTVERFRATRAQFAATPFEGRMRLNVTGTWTPATQDIAPHGLFVPIAQPLARLVMHLLEPQAPDSYCAWGFFNACFEQKEYLEPYVAEQIARSMLAQDPALEREFTQVLSQDPAFAADPSARREFFLRRHSSWDSQLDLYPVLRVADNPAAVGATDA
jgi:hypothetical protein